MSTIKVKVDIPSSLDMTSVRVRNALTFGMRAMGEQAYQFWRSLADAELNTSYQLYTKSMDLKYEAGPAGIDSPVISISGALPIMVEFGAPKFDMKDQLLKGRKPHADKPYAFVPMRHAMEGSAGNRRMNVPPMPIVKVMRGKPIGMILRRLKGDYHTTGRVKGYRSLYPRYERLTKFSTGWHTFRTMQPPGKGKQANAWWHPGFKPRLLHERLLEYVERTLVPKIMVPVFELLK